MACCRTGCYLKLAPLSGAKPKGVSAMRKQVLALVAVCLFVALLSGCPKPVEPVKQGVSVYIDLNSSVPVGDQKGYSYPEIPLGYQRQIGAAFKAQAAWLELTFYMEYTEEDKGGGYPTQEIVRTIPVVDGIAQDTIALAVGRYSVGSRILNTNWQPLFEAYGETEVVANTVTPTELEFDFLYSYTMNFQITGLPAVSVASVLAIDQGNVEYNTITFYQNGDGLYAYIGLPLSFDGSALMLNLNDGGQLLVDLPLTMYAVNFGLYNLGDYYPIAYQAPESAGQVVIDATFGFEERFIRVNGLDYQSIQEAALSSTNPTIMVGPGDYYGLELNPGLARSVTIIGAGAGVTRIFSGDSGPAIMMDAGAGGLGKAAIAPTLRLANVAVDAYNSYVGISVWGCSLDMSNCHVFGGGYFQGGGGTSLVMAGNPSGVSIDHCLFESDAAFAIELDNYQSDLVSVKNSIFASYQQLYNPALYLATYDSNGSAGLLYRNCCFWQVNQAWPADVFCDNAITADPMLDWMTMLPAEGSPCIDAGDDGFNIGLIWSK
jgi:hypothetical protein